MSINLPHGGTPISEDELDGLRISTVTTLEELNRVEAQNISSARLKVFGRKKKEWLVQSFFKQVHKDMFGEVWKWGGLYRRSDKNIGINWQTIPTEVEVFLGDVKYWLESKLDEAEMLARFHHRLVKIHPFPNGNGRHSRFMTDFLSFNEKLSVKVTWPLVELMTNPGDVRRRYIAALQAADKHNYEPLKEFINAQ
jgi:Fic-DOC domain mobile mystery protein B